MGRAQQPGYTVAASQEAIELRDYGPLIVAETVAPGDRETAIQAGFRRLAGYIFGGNAEARRIAMTAPVLQLPTVETDADDAWRVRFIMPEGMSLDDLPAPRQTDVQLLALPPARRAVIRFSGRPTPALLARHREALRAFLEAHALRALAPPAYAFYDPPWTPPFLRRNEVMVEVATP